MTSDIGLTSRDLRPDYPGLLPGRLRADADALDERLSGRVRRSTRDWLVDVAFFLIAIVIGAGVWSGLFGRAHHQWTAQLAVDAGVGVLCCLAVWWRRRAPIAVAAIALVFSTFSGAATGAALIALFTVGVHRRFVPLAILTVATIVGQIPYTYIHPDPTLPFWASMLVSTALTAAVSAWAMFVRARRQLVLSLQERTHRAETEQQLRIEQARHLERERIAREMHDVLAHRISLLSLHAGALEYRRNASPDEIASAAGVIRDSAHQALQELREVITLLREPEPDDRPSRPQPTLPDLPELLRDSQLAGVRIRLDNRLDDLTTVPASTGRNAYRILQEALTNARKHSRGAVVRIRLAGSARDGLTIEVRNRMPEDGLSESEIPGSSRGLIGLQERVQLAGGQLRHGTTATDEFRLWVWLPWSA